MHQAKRSAKEKTQDIANRPRTIRKLYSISIARTAARTRPTMPPGGVHMQHVHVLVIYIDIDIDINIYMLKQRESHRCA
jgi:hypothetical protein